MGITWFFKVSSNIIEIIRVDDLREALFMRQRQNKLINATWFRIIVILMALELIAIAINFFYAPINVAAGGATGVSILLNAAFGFDRALTVLVINLLMIILAAFFLEKRVVKNIAFGSLALPVLLNYTPSYPVVDDSVLAVIIGGAVFATGVAILYRLDASAGGTTVPPMILKKYFHINTAYSLLVIDMTITLFNLFVAGTNAFFLAGFSLVITSMVMRRIETGLDLKQQVTIMSNDYGHEIRDALLSEEQSLTMFDVRGGYTDNDREMLMVLVDSQDYGHLIRIIREIDDEAFVVTTNVTESHGGTMRLGS